MEPALLIPSSVFFAFPTSHQLARSLNSARTPTPASTVRNPVNPSHARTTTNGALPIGDSAFRRRSIVYFSTRLAFHFRHLNLLESNRFVCGGSFDYWTTISFLACTGLSSVLSLIISDIVSVACLLDVGEVLLFLLLALFPQPFTSICLCHSYQKLFTYSSQ